MQCTFPSQISSFRQQLDFLSGELGCRSLHSKSAAVQSSRLYVPVSCCHHQWGVDENQTLGKEHLFGDGKEGSAGERMICATGGGGGGGRQSRGGLTMASRVARRDATILARGLLKLDSRAKEDVAVIGSTFLTLDARARGDATILDSSARQKMKRLRYIAMGLEQTALRTLDDHWSDGALADDFRIANIRMQRRAREDAYAAMQAMRQLNDAVEAVLRLKKSRCSLTAQSLASASKPLQSPQQSDKVLSSFNRPGLKHAGMDEEQLAERALDALEGFYHKMGISVADMDDDSELSDSEEVELLVAALLDFDEVNGGQGALLLSEIVRSPDVSTRKAIADALGAAPSLWALGNAGLGALQKLANDKDEAVASAARAALKDLQSRWQKLCEGNDIEN